MPFGFLAAIAVLRTRPRHRRRARGAARHALAGAAISFAMETLQSYLPARIPSNVDLGLNIAGALAGAVLAAALRAARRGGALAAARASNWFVDESRGALVLLALWPVGAAVSGRGHLRAGPGVRAARRRDLRMAASTRPSSTGCRCASSNSSRWSRRRNAVRHAGCAGALPARLPGHALGRAARHPAAADAAGGMAARRCRRR